MSANRRAPAGRTLDPCHGCGLVPSEWRGRPKAGVCDNCRNTLDLAQRAAKEQAARGDEIGEFYLPTQPHWLPYLPHDRSEGFGSHPIQTALWKLALAVSSPNVGKDVNYNATPIFSNPNPSGSSGHLGRECSRMLRADIAAQLDGLLTTVHAGLQFAHEDGKQDGTNMIAQLAAGGITVNQLNEFTLKGRG